MFVKSEKRAIRIAGVRIPVGQLAELPDDLLPSIQHLIKTGHISVHSFDPNSPKAAPRKAPAPPQKPKAPAPEPEEKPKAKITRKRNRKKAPKKAAVSKDE